MRNSHVEKFHPRPPQPPWTLPWGSCHLQTCHDRPGCRPHWWSEDTPKSVGVQAPPGASIKRIGDIPVVLPTFHYKCMDPLIAQWQFYKKCLQANVLKKKNGLWLVGKFLDFCNFVYKIVKAWYRYLGILSWKRHPYSIGYHFSTACQRSNLCSL